MISVDERDTYNAKLTSGICLIGVYLDMMIGVLRRMNPLILAVITE